MLDVNILSNVATNLASILFLFPNLSHLTLLKPTLNANPEVIANLSLCLSEFKNQNSLTLKDVNFDHINPFLGDRIGKGNKNVFSNHQILLKSTYKNLVKWQQD